MAKRKKPAKTGREGKPPPSCKAMIIAEKVIIEKDTEKVSIINIFNGFLLSEFPGKTGPAAAFVQMIDGIGRYDITVEVHDLKENKVIARAGGMNIAFPETRLGTVNFMINIPPIPLQHPGAYDVVVLADGQEIERQKFHASERTAEGES